MKQSCNKKEKNRTNIFLREKARKKMKTYKINIFKHETKKGNTVK
jgi:hypothetical protein